MTIFNGNKALPLLCCSSEFSSIKEDQALRSSLCSASEARLKTRLNSTKDALLMTPVRRHLHVASAFIESAQPAAADTPVSYRKVEIVANVLQNTELVTSKNVPLLDCQNKILSGLFFISLYQFALGILHTKEKTSLGISEKSSSMIKVQYPSTIY